MHVSVAPLAAVSASVTELESAVTVFPPASCTVTTGWVPSVVPAVAVAEGWVVNASFAAALTVTLGLVPLAVHE